VVCVSDPRCTGGSRARTEVLLGRAACVLNDLNETRAQGLDRRDVVREDTHVAGRGGQVDLGNLGRNDSLCTCKTQEQQQREQAEQEESRRRRWSAWFSPGSGTRTDLVREDEGELDFVHGLGIAAAAARGGQSRRRAPGGGRGEAKGGHGEVTVGGRARSRGGARNSRFGRCRGSPSTRTCTSCSNLVMNSLTVCNYYLYNNVERTASDSEPTSKKSLYNVC
jgi:hypothetical protein